MKLTAIGVGFVMAFGAHAANAAEVWSCTLHPRGDVNAITVGFEVRGHTLLRSPDDYSGKRMAYRITKNNRAILTATASRGFQTVAIRKQSLNATMTGRRATGWQDVWEGPCHKV
jgi:hypothetical protein